MAQSKFVKANEEISKKVVGAFEKMEGAVVGGYEKVEDAFVERYLTRDGETAEDAKARLRKQQKGGESRQ